MQTEYTAEQVAFREMLRDYFVRVKAEFPEGHSPINTVEYRKFVRRLGADGWLGLGFPKKWGGQERSASDTVIFIEEAERAGIFLPVLATYTVGPVLAEFGTEEQKQKYLPGIIAGEILFSIGYTESNAGTDLASLATRAVVDGDDYVINGQKLFTTMIAVADYIWLATRTDPEAKKHHGISVIIVPTNSEGFSWTELPVLEDETGTSITTYENVRVPRTNVVGGENQGWKLMMSQLNRERVFLFGVSPVDKYCEEVIELASIPSPVDGSRLIDKEWVRMNIAEYRARAAVSHMMVAKLAEDYDNHRLTVEQSSMCKILTTEIMLDGCRLLLEVIGQAAYVSQGSPYENLSRRLVQNASGWVRKTFGGGANDMLRAVVAERGMGMARQ